MQGDIPSGSYTMPFIFDFQICATIIHLICDTIIHLNDSWQTEVRASDGRAYPPLNRHPDRVGLQAAKYHYRFCLVHLQLSLLLLLRNPPPLKKLALLTFQ